MLEPFSEKGEVAEIVLKFVKADIIYDQSLYALTSFGKELFNNCTAKQKEFREKTMTGITERDYEITVETLAQLIKILTNKAG